MVQSLQWGCLAYFTVHLNPDGYGVGTCAYVPADTDWKNKNTGMEMPVFPHIIAMKLQRLCGLKCCGIIGLLYYFRHLFRINHLVFSVQNDNGTAQQSF